MVDYAIKLVNVSKSFNYTTYVYNEKKKKKVKKNKQVISDVSLNIAPGEIVGILGRNGSGKSTLLSIISKIQDADDGDVIINGSLAAILELGMGFNIELSGRENIYIKGELYGFSKKKIDSIIDSIITYSGIEEYIDNPIRTYSSGMTSRLAFSIMVHVNADIMIVDEVLSTGDISFTKRSKEHFKKLAKQGKTILLVSHNMQVVEDLCTRVLWLEHGKIVMDGDPKKVCSDYIYALSESPDIVKELASNGDAAYQYKLALLYRDGVSVEKDPSEYKKWLQRSADQQYIKAMIEYGDCIAKTDPETSLQYYEAAAKYGDPQAMMRISGAYSDDLQKKQLFDIYDQITIPNNNADEKTYGSLLYGCNTNSDERYRSFIMLKSSADHGNAESMYLTALLYRDGFGIQRNTEKMEEYLLRAAENDYLPAISLLANIYFDGKLLKKDNEKSFNLFLKGARLGDRTSMFRIAMMYKQGAGTSCSQDHASYWFKQYANSNIAPYLESAGDRLSVQNLGDMDPLQLYTIANEANSTPELLIKIVKIKITRNQPVEEELTKLDEAANKGNIVAIKFLANLYDNDCNYKNPEKAYSYYLKGYYESDLECIKKCAIMYYKGIGTNRNYDRAFKLLLESSIHGDIESLNIIIGMMLLGKIDGSQVTRVIALLEQMSKCGCVESFGLLGKIYYYGIGVEENKTLALDYYEKGSQLGDHYSKYQFARILLNSKNAEDRSKALVICNELLDANVIDVCDLLLSYHRKNHDQKNELMIISKRNTMIDDGNIKIVNNLSLLEEEKKLLDEKKDSDNKYKVVVLDGKDYDLNINHVLYQQSLGNISVKAILTKYRNWKTIDGINAISSEELLSLDYDYIIVMDIDNYVKIARDLSKELNIPIEKIISISPFREPLFNFQDYVKIKDTKVTIISDNCWGGYAYHFLGLEFMSPFINMYMNDSHFIKLVKNTDHYMNCELTFNRYEEENGQKYPIANLDDIEIHLNHYKTFEEAKEKWISRLNKVNYESILYVTRIYSKQTADYYSGLLPEKKILGVTFDNYDNPDFTYINEWGADGIQVGWANWNLHNRFAEYKAPHSAPFYLSKLLAGKEYDRRTYISASTDVDYHIQASIKQSGAEILSLLYLFPDYLINSGFTPSSKTINYLLEKANEIGNYDYCKRLSKMTKIDSDGSYHVGVAFYKTAVTDDDLRIAVDWLKKCSSHNKELAAILSEIENKTTNDELKKELMLMKGDDDSSH